MRIYSVVMGGVAATALMATAASASVSNSDSTVLTSASGATSQVDDVTVPAKKRVQLAQNGSNAHEAADAQKLDELEQRLEALESEVQASEQREASDKADMSGWADKMKGWWNDTTISGRMYYDLTDINNTHQVATTNPAGPFLSNKDSASGFSFDIKRFYIGIDHNFNSWLSADFTTDVNYNTSVKASSPGTVAGQQLDVFVKKAYIQMKYDDMLTVRIGSADMPWIPYAEDAYGMRFVEKTLVDRVSFGNSADWGVHILGKFLDGMVDYQVSAVNGSGFKTPVRTQQPDIEARIGFHPFEGFTAAVGAYNGVEGYVKCGSTVVPGTCLVPNPLHHHYTRLDALVAYTWMGLHVGAEYFYAQNHGNESGAPLASFDGYGYTGYASYQVMPEWSVFGRYDYVHPKNDATIATHLFHNNYFNVGVDYTPQKWVDFALVYKNDMGSRGNFSDGNGTIGGSAAAGLTTLNDNGTYSEVGLFGQVRW